MAPASRKAAGTSTTKARISRTRRARGLTRPRLSRSLHVLLHAHRGQRHQEQQRRGGGPHRDLGEGDVGRLQRHEQDREHEAVGGDGQHLPARLARQHHARAGQRDEDQQDREGGSSHPLPDLVAGEDRAGDGLVDRGAGDERHDEQQQDLERRAGRRPSSTKAAITIGRPAPSVTKVAQCSRSIEDFSRAKPIAPSQAEARARASSRSMTKPFTKQAPSQPSAP